MSQTHATSGAEDHVYVNLQDTPVMVFDEYRQRVELQPLRLAERHPDGKYQVVGEHYKQFKHPYGPLSSFRPQNTTPTIAKRIAEGFGRVAQAADFVPRSDPLMPQPIQPIVAASGEAERAIKNLDKSILDRVVRETPDASPNVRADLCVFIFKKINGQPAALHSTFAAAWGRKMETIVGEVMTQRREKEHDALVAAAKASTVPVTGGSDSDPDPVDGDSDEDKKPPSDTGTAGAGKKTTGGKK